MEDMVIGPVAFATGAASLFGAQAIFGKRGLAYVDAQAGAMITIGVSAAVYWLLAPALLRAEYWLHPALWVFVANGCIHPMFSMYLSFEANRHMGPTVSSTVAATAPLFATAGAAAALGEAPAPAILAGMALTVGGIMALSWSGRGQARTWALSALAFPTGAALVRATNFVLGRYGMELLPVPYFAGLVSFTVSFAGSVLLYHHRHGRLPLRLPLEGLRWNAYGGLCVAGAILCMYAALGSGLVAVVSPIVAAYPLFTLAYSLLFRQEVLSGRVLLGVLLVIGGVVWISVQ